MGCKKLTRDDEKALRLFVADLPTVMNETSEVHIVTGKELIEIGEVLPDGGKIDPEKKYPYRMPVKIASNHYRQIKRAYLKNGQAGITAYLQFIKRLMEKQNNGVEI